VRGWRRQRASVSSLAATKRAASAACIAAALTLLGPGAVTGPLLSSVSAQGASPLDLQRNPTNWATVLGNYQGWRYSPLNQINASNASRLTVAWTFSTGVLRGHEGSPLVVGSTMYVNTPWPNIVYALDLTKPGAPIKWRFVPENEESAVGVACCDTESRGLFYADGRIFMNTLDGKTIALDATTGKVLWSVKQADPSKGQTITMMPLVVKNIVLSGVSGGEFGVRGFITANDAATGRQLWRAYNTGPDDEVKIGPSFKPFYANLRGTDLGVSTWPQDQWKIGGATVWGWLTYDPDLDLVYYGTSNPGTWNPSLRPGRNLWSTTVFARRPETGEAVWAYPWTPHDEWDYDGVNENILVDQPIKGRMRKTLVHFDRNGYAYTLDRQTGEVLVAQPYVYQNVWKSFDYQTGLPVPNPDKETKQGVNTTDICPSAMGGRDVLPAAYSPRTGLFYTIANNLCMDYEGTQVNYTAGAPYVGATVKMYPGPGGNHSEFIAWDARTGRKVWGIKNDVGLWSGTLATAGDVVFYGDLQGFFYAVNARTGRVLWKFKTGSGIIGSPFAFRGPDGKEYVGVYSGVGGWAGLTVSGDLSLDDPTGALGAVNAWKHLVNYTAKGGMLYVFTLQ
jgi:PQQ-dependent dehydrogenase (methanol/ethanol family)